MLRGIGVVMGNRGIHVRGIGAVMGNRGICVHLPEHVQSQIHSIFQVELGAVIIAFVHWKNYLANRKVVMAMDNEAVVFAVSKGSMKDRLAQDLLHELSWHAA